MPVVEDLHPLEDGGLGLLPRPVPTPDEELELHRVEEALDHGVVGWRTGASHGRQDPGLTQPAAEGEARVLGTLIAVVDEPRGRPAARGGHLHGLDHQLGPKVGGHRPAHDSSGPQVHHRRDVEKPQSVIITLDEPLDGRTVVDGAA